MIRQLAFRVCLVIVVCHGASGQSTGANSGVDSIVAVKRIYVAQLTGGTQADALRDLIISGLDSTKLFVLTENEARADAVLRGAADDKAFTDSYDSDENLSSRENAGKSSSLSSTRLGSGIYGGIGMGGNESHHIRERKHEAYATVRLCNKDGDVLWSTTQESLGAKFRSAGADVAAKVAHQLVIDYQKAQTVATSTTTVAKR
jgi:hypothetical protein